MVSERTDGTVDGADNDEVDIDGTADMMDWTEEEMDGAEVVVEAVVEVVEDGAEDGMDGRAASIGCTDAGADCTRDAIDGMDGAEVEVEAVVEVVADGAEDGMDGRAASIGCTAVGMGMASARFDRREVAEDRMEDCLGSSLSIESISVGTESEILPPTLPTTAAPVSELAPIVFRLAVLSKELPELLTLLSVAFANSELACLNVSEEKMQRQNLQ